MQIVNSLFSAGTNIAYTESTTKAEYGARSKKGAERVLADVNALFAGGEMAEEDLDVFMQAVQEAYWNVKRINKEKYTPKKFLKDNDD